MDQDHKSKGSRAGRIALWFGIIGNALLIVAKAFLGVVGRSQALIADAVHSFTDFATDILAFAGLKYAEKGEDEDHPFGHGKIETLMTLLIGLTLVAVGIWIGYTAAASMMAGSLQGPTYVALIGALVSIAVKEWMYQYTVRVGRRIKSNVLVANAWHHRSDAFSSIAAALGIGGALIHPSLIFLDPLAALLVAGFIVKVGFDIIVPAFQTAADAAPEQSRLDEIQAVAESVEGVRNTHDLKARQYASKLHVEIHIVVDPGIPVVNGHMIANSVRDAILNGVEDILEVIVHVDPDKTQA
ncbi:MAG TPA: cation diffusion facilitator family transporter [Acidobacteriota bacterium]|nr:cation diffusion facilitator family transporter [Acidobacteriota bacterium]